MIIYSIPDFDDLQQSVEVTYTNDEGWTIVRTLNIPWNEDGSLDEDRWEHIKMRQLESLLYKVKIGVSKFKDPNESDDADTPKP